MKQTCSFGRTWGPKYSIWWSDLILLRCDAIPNQNFFHNAVSCTLEDGSSILLWHNHWLGLDLLKVVFPNLFAISSH